MKPSYEQLEQQLAEFQSKLAQMAAENAGLKSHLQGTAEYCYSELPETPAIDSFLAEVRAQGVEMFADDLLCPDLDSTIREFAEQLRKGVQS